MVVLSISQKQFNMNTTKRINSFVKKGWCPVPYGHHPNHIKQAIKLAGFRPQMKCCHANAQKLITNQNKINLRYVEGIVAGMIPIQHAWVIDENDQFHDITLNPMPQVICYKIYSKIDVIENMAKTNMYTFIDHHWLDIMKEAVLLGLDTSLSTDVIAEKIIQIRNFQIEKLNSLNLSV